MLVKVYDKLGYLHLKECSKPVEVLRKGEKVFVACCKCDECIKGKKELGFGLHERNEEG